MKIFNKYIIFTLIIIFSYFFLLFFPGLLKKIPSFIFVAIAFVFLLSLVFITIHSLFKRRGQGKSLWKTSNQLYRLLVILEIGLIVWNLYITIGILMSSAWQHSPFLQVLILLLWGGLTIVGWVLLKIMINKKTGIIITMILFGIFPIIPHLFRSSILNYIVSWENAHCVKIANGRLYWVDYTKYTDYKCDNGDLISKSNDSSDMKRTFDGGIKNTHYPHSWLY